MPIRDEKVFSDEERIAAFSLILPPDQAREEGLGFNALPDLTGLETATGAELAGAPARGPRSYREICSTSCRWLRTTAPSGLGA